MIFALTLFLHVAYISQINLNTQTDTGITYCAFSNTEHGRTNPLFYYAYLNTVSGRTDPKFYFESL